MNKPETTPPTYFHHIRYSTLRRLPSLPESDGRSWREAAKRDGGAAVVARMKAMPTDDDCFGQQRIRADGLFLCPSYLFQVKSPEESTHSWDCYKLLATTPVDDAWQPIAEGQCALLKTGHMGKQVER